MADTEAEIDSFVGKFRQLWRAGFDVHFDLNAHAGNAWLGLRLNLGQHQQKATHQEGEFLKKRPSPSRIRRRERRAASRNDANLTDNDGGVDILHKDFNENVESEKSDDVQTVAVAEEANSMPTENLAIEEAFTQGDASVENTGSAFVEDAVVENLGSNSEVDNCVSDDAQPVGHEPICVISNVFANNDVHADDEVKVDAKIDIAAKDVIELEQPNYAIIHATAIVQNSPNQSFSQDEWDSILRFITNKDHLKKNVMSVECCQSASRDLSYSGFTYSVVLKNLVRTKNL